MKTSHVRQENSITEDTQAVRASWGKEHGAGRAWCGSAAVGTDAKVLTLTQGEGEEDDCQGGGSPGLLVFLFFSRLTVSASKEDSSEILRIKGAGAPAPGSA